jgi:hypothetical protein
MSSAWLIRRDVDPETSASIIEMQSAVIGEGCGVLGIENIQLLRKDLPAGESHWPFV